uniref:Uncharacterized protein n=1 Tax=Pristionchus pacificus TaxID=54126 RepID=A0A2A6CKE2_PRIPA|eukprot:PDM78547.1 hypothetical protein PRIPAC_31126 [Pristionchus pacificus]
MQCRLHTIAHTLSANVYQGAAPILYWTCGHGE